MLNISLDIARGLAALWVFIYHVRLGIEPGLLRRFADAGLLGVPLFFVISGYCMMASGRSIIARQRTARSFLARRLRRIFPPFWISIGVVVLIPFAAAAIVRLRGYALTWPAPAWMQYSAGDWLAVATLTRGLFEHGPAHLPYSAVNSVYWSLAIEVQFYLVVAFALVFRRRFGAILSLITAGSLAMWWLVGPFAPGFFAEYWPMFALGLLLYAALEKGVSPARVFGRWAAPASVTACLAIAAAALGLTLLRPSVSLERQTLFAVFCAAILWTGSGFESALPRDTGASRALTGLGKMSYSIYLLHIQLISFVIPLLRPYAPRRGVLAVLLYMAATGPLAYVFYRYCERPYVGERTAKAV